MSLQPFQFDNLWVALALWALLYSADYFLTLRGAGLMQQYGQVHFDMGGSYELNPFYQKDIDRLRRVSPRFIGILIGFGVWLVVMWLFADLAHLMPAFAAGAGFLILMEVSVLGGHVRNIALFTALKTPGSVVGRIQYSRWVSIRLATWSFGLWGLLYALFFALTGSWFFFGGIISMFVLFTRYSRMGSLLRRQLEKQQDQIEESEV
ncbi:MAG: hypothetical protein H6672_05705 [Anaerolineaceae bacterium]|nr:hypothetical protein [Anaerolineaceae bacterium]